jgi:WD40 repeat protein
MGMRFDIIIKMNAKRMSAIMLALFVVSASLLGLMQREMDYSEDQLDAQIGKGALPLSDKGNGIRSYNTDQIEEIWNGTNHTNVVYSVSYSPDGSKIASASFDGTIKVWDSWNGSMILNWTAHPDFVLSVDWSPNGTWIASGSVDNTIKIWNSSDGGFIRTLSGHTEMVDVVAFSPNGTWLASGSDDNTTKFWNVSTGNEINSLPNPDWAEHIDWSPNGTWLAVDSDNNVTIWDVPTWTIYKNLTPMLNGYSGPVKFSPNGTWLAGGYPFGTSVWNVTTGVLEHTLWASNAPILSLSWAPDGHVLAGGSDPNWVDGDIQLWNVSTATLINHLIGHTSYVYSVEWSPNGTRLVSGSDDHTVRVWGDQTPPRVIAVEPPDTAFDVPVNTKLNITFNESMNKTSVENSISISPPVGIQSFSWTGNKTTVTFASNLAGNTPYTVTINSSIAKDYSENYLDGNENGVSEFSPADDYDWSFTTIDLNSPPDAPVGLGVQGFIVAPSIINITDHNPVLNWTFVDPDLEAQSGYNATVWDSTKTTLLWFNNLTSSSESDIYNSTGTATMNLTDGQDYWFRVQTNDSSDAWSVWSEVMFHMNTPPPEPTLVSPPDDSQQPAGLQTLVWSPVVDSEMSAVVYYWFVSLDPGFSVLEASGSTPGTSDTFTTLLGRDYYWRVQAYDSYEYGLNSTAWNFTTPPGNNPPNMPSGLGVQSFISSPDILNITDHNPDLNWTFNDPDMDTQFGYNITVWDSTKTTLLWYNNVTSSSSSDTYNSTGTATNDLMDGSDYWFRAQTVDTWAVWSPWSETRFHMNTPPPVPTLVSPPDESQQGAGLQTLDWNGIADPEGSSPTYYWYVSTDPGFPQPLNASGTNPGTTDSFMSFPNNNYYWRVQAFDGYEFGANSTTWNFTAITGNNPPNAPLGLGVQGFTSSPHILNITDHTPDLNWTFSDPDPGDTQSAYNVTVWTGPGGTGTLMFWEVQISDAQSTVYSGLPLDDGTSYYLRIRTMDFTSLWGPWSEKRFHMNTPPPAPMLLNPPDGTEDLGESLQDLNWTAVNDAEGSPITYHWYIAEDINFAVLISGGSSGSPSISYGTQFSRTYYWRVRANDGYEFGANSTTFMFETVYNGSMSGNVTDTNGNPLEGAIVTILGTMLSTNTNASGEYYFPDVVPNTYFVTAAKAGYASSTKTAVITVNEHNVTDFMLIITRGSIKGTVQDEDGKPLEGATVRLLDNQGNEVGIMTTNSTGHYLFEDLQFGSYTITASKEGYDDNSRDINVLSPTTAQLEPIKLKKIGEPFPLWVVAAIAAIVVILLLLFFLLMRKRSGREEGEEPVEEPQEKETELSGRYGLEEEQLSEGTEPSDSEETFSKESDFERPSGEETEVSDQEKDTTDGETKRETSEGDEEFERMTD